MSGKTSTARVEEGISLQQRTVFKTEQVPSCGEVRVNSRSHRGVSPFLPEHRTLGFTVSATTAGRAVTGKETLLSGREGLQSCVSDYIHPHAQGFTEGLDSPFKFCTFLNLTNLSLWLSLSPTQQKGTRKCQPCGSLVHLFSGYLLRIKLGTNLVFHIPNVHISASPHPRRSTNKLRKFQHGTQKSVHAGTFSFLEKAFRRIF